VRGVLLPERSRADDPYANDTLGDAAMSVA
jgi:hypothetical protein